MQGILKEYNESVEKPSCERGISWIEIAFQNSSIKFSNVTLRSADHPACIASICFAL
jgi:hypothetical protein